jgi:Subtilase family
MTEKNNTAYCAPVRPIRRLSAGLVVLCLITFGANGYASTLDIIGLTLLRATTTNLDGTGVRVGQAEAQGVGDGDWEVTPSTNGIELPISDFTWYSTNAMATTFPNALGIDSGHADEVGGDFYGLPGGVSTNVLHIDNFEADDFFGDRVPALTAISDRIVNQSFNSPTNYQSPYDQDYDNFAADYHVLFVSTVGDGLYGFMGEEGTAVLPPGTCYNGIGVGNSQNTNVTSIGPTLDNGRAKPDIAAPGDADSYAAPLVSGAAAILTQAGLRGDGGSDTNSAADIRTVKALLLNGAHKPPTWSNPAPSPLDPVYGTGVLNVFDSYHQLLGGKHGYTTTSIAATNTAHPPVAAAGNVSSLVGWNLAGITSTPVTDTINHYYFEVTNSSGSSPFVGTVTLVWNRQQNQPTINNLDLFLYNAANSNLIAYSASQVDNVEHLYVPQLPAGRYDLQVLKHGGAFTTASETYALAFEFYAMQLSITNVSGGVLASWPIYPDGFFLSGSPNFAPGSWSDVNPAPGITNGMNQVFISTAEGPLYLRLYRFP